VDPKVIAAGTMMKRMGTVDECAKALAFLMSDDASYITGGMTSLLRLARMNELN
jgi:NAD(P)-dependent dehydrogenase (short-subunit alcohol dehydrogenase family)